MINLFQSTHPRGVRRPSANGRKKDMLFQSTHPRGVRRPHASVACLDDNFNPRTRVGCDVPLLWDNRLCGRDFNPRTRVGCDRTYSDEKLE